MNVHIYSVYCIILYFYTLLFALCGVKLIGIWCSRTLSDQIELQAELWRRAQESQLPDAPEPLPSHPAASSSASSSGQQRGARNKNKNKKNKNKNADNARSRARTGRNQLRAEEMELIAPVNAGGAGPSSIRSWRQW